METSNSLTLQTLRVNRQKQIELKNKAEELIRYYDGVIADIERSVSPQTLFESGGTIELPKSNKEIVIDILKTKKKMQLKDIFKEFQKKGGTSKIETFRVNIADWSRNPRVPIEKTHGFGMYKYSAA